MVTILAWVLLGVMAVIPLLQVLVCLRKGKQPKQRRVTTEDFQAMRDLYAIHRRFDVAWFEVGLRRDAADARRALRVELDKLDRWSRS